MCLVCDSQLYIGHALNLSGRNVSFVTGTPKVEGNRRDRRGMILKGNYILHQGLKGSFHEWKLYISHIHRIKPLSVGTQTLGNYLCTLYL